MKQEPSDHKKEFKGSLYGLRKQQGLYLFGYMLGGKDYSVMLNI